MPIDISPVLVDVLVYEPAGAFGKRAALQINIYILCVFRGSTFSFENLE